MSKKIFTSNTNFKRKVRWRDEVARRIGLIALILVAVLASVPVRSATMATSCPEVEAVFARGSGEELEGPSFRAYRQAVGASFAEYAPNLSVGYYELGSGSYGGASYPAVTVENITTLTGAAISLGSGFDFGESVSQGVTELVNYLSTRANTCPETQYIIAGYSQGAMVVSQALAKITVPDKILHAATVADPKLYLPEGKVSVMGATPPACRGQNLSAYRANVPDCKVSNGILRGSNPYASGYDEKVGAWCHNGDPVCGSFPSASKMLSDGAIAQHLTYISDNTYTEVANYAVNMARAKFGSDVVANTAPVSSNKRDTAVVIDSTGSMEGLYEQYKTEALKVARSTLDQGGRIALYEYRDELVEDFTPRKLCDFSCSYEEFAKALDQIELDGGEDEPESALSALLKVMNELTWEQGATKSIVLLTDASYHTTDVGGVTLPQVVQRSREIDPVNVYVVTEAGLAEVYSELASQTGGKVFTTEEEYEASTTILTSRPGAHLALENYYAYLGEEVTFDASASVVEGVIDHYEWDLDFDGAYEVTTTVPYITKTYNAVGTGLMQVKVVDTTGLESNMTATVTIMDSARVPKIKSYTLRGGDGQGGERSGSERVDERDGGGSVEITLEAENTAMFVLGMDGYLLGITTDTELRLTGLPESGTNINITPLGEDGWAGEGIEILTGKFHLRAPATGAYRASKD